MPSSATITAFYTFVANTKARASQANNNFDTFRGHLLSVDPLTATSSQYTYDLGSAEHRWRYGYMAELNLGYTTTSWRIYDDATTSGNLIFRFNGSDVMKFNSAGIFSTNTVALHSLRARPISTTGADTSPAGIIVGAQFEGNTAGAADFGGTVTVSTAGRPVMIGIMGGTGGSSVDNLMSAFVSTNTTGSYTVLSEWQLKRNGTIISRWRMDGGAVVWTAGSTQVLMRVSDGPGILAIDTDLTTGANSYSLYANPTTGTTVKAAGRLYAFGIY